VSGNVGSPDPTWPASLDTLKVCSSALTLRKRKKREGLKLKLIQIPIPPERMSRFPARCCIMRYETILLLKKETTGGCAPIRENKDPAGSPACAGGNHLGRPGNIHPNVCANDYHL
jgi:hypothetical protein